jgi:hypothetical protein
MELSDIGLSDYAKERCPTWGVTEEEVCRARLDGTILWEGSAIENGWVTVFGPRRADGRHIVTVCGPDPFVVNDFHLVKSRPAFKGSIVGVRPLTP